MPGDDYCLPAPNTPALNLKFLAAAEAVGLKVFLRDARIDAICNKNNPHPVPLSAIDAQALDSVIYDYRGQPALAGYFLVDEPDQSGSMNPLLAAVVTYFRANDPEHVCFINNYPFPRADENYYKQFVYDVKPFALSYDNYFFQEPPTPDDPTDFLRNLNIARSVTLPYDLPFWVIVQAIKHTILHRAYRQPTEAEKRFEVMQSLAFGAKAILYFTYWTPSDPGAAWYPAIVDKTGVPTSQYDEVTRINADVRALGKYLLSTKSVMVYDSITPPATGLDPPPRLAPVRLAYTAAVTVGIFTDATYTYALLANRDYRDGTAGPAAFGARIVIRLDKETGTWVNAGRLGEVAAIKLSLGAGDAELYCLIAPRVFFETTDGELEQLSLTLTSDGDGWNASKTGNTASAGRITGSIAAYETTFGIGRTARIVYRDGNGRVREAFQILVSENWAHGDLTDLAGAPLAAGDPFGYVSDFGPLGPQARVVYRGKDAHIHELSLSAKPGHWAHRNLTEQAGAPPAAGDPFVLTSAGA
jgi:hypothetical protein